MKIVDRGAPPTLTLRDIAPGETVRLKNGKVYLIGLYNAPPDTPDFSFGRGFHVKQRVLINPETGACHKLGEDSACTRVDATLTVN